MTHAPWQLIVPIKPPHVAKSRLHGSADLARAIAHDTVAAAAAADSVGRVIVVTADAGQAAALVGLDKVAAVLEVAPRGIAAAIAAGRAELDRWRRPAPRAVLLGDVPALRASDLDEVLVAAAQSDRAFVRDADGTGTTLVTARADVDLDAHFGPDSAARHLAAGLTEIRLPADSTLRRDVDTPDDLAAARFLGLGPATRAALQRAEALPG